MILAHKYLVSNRVMDDCGIPNHEWFEPIYVDWSKVVMIRNYETDPSTEGHVSEPCTLVSFGGDSYVLNMTLKEALLHMNHARNKP